MHTSHIKTHECVCTFSRKKKGGKINDSIPAIRRISKNSVIPVIASIVI